MVDEFDLLERTFSHAVLEGSAYEVGQQLADLIRTKKEWMKFLTSANLDVKELGFQNFSDLQAMFDDHCPGILDEIQGFTDALNLSPKRLSFWEFAYRPFWGTFCSQFTVLSPATLDNHIYIGRSYEWNTQEDLTFCTTRVKGKARHMGCSTFLFGRNDGLNEHGLGASFTGGGIFGVNLTCGGLAHDIAIRILLDHCQSVDEALNRLQQIPLSGFFSLLLTDRMNNAALVEFADGIISVKRIAEHTPEPFLYSTNHFSLPNTRNYNSLNNCILNQSKGRYTLLSSFLREKTPRIRKTNLKQVLSKSYPEGVCDHYYNDGFGTLWSCIFDLTTKAVDICFGAPTHNNWRIFTFNNSPAGITTYDIIFPNLNKKWPYN